MVFSIQHPTSLAFKSSVAPRVMRFNSMPLSPLPRSFRAYSTHLFSSPLSSARYPLTRKATLMSRRAWQPNFPISLAQRAAYDVRAMCSSSSFEKTSLGICLTEIHTKDKKGMTPLHLAVEAKDLSTVKKWAKAGANVNTPNNKGRTPLDTAQKNRDAEMGAFLLAYNAKTATSILKQLIDEVPLEKHRLYGDGMTSLHWDVSIHSATARYHMVNKSLIQGQNPHITKRGDPTCLDRAKATNCPEMIALMHRRGVLTAKELEILITFNLYASPR